MIPGLILTSKKATAKPVNRRPFGDAKTPEEKIKIIIDDTRWDDPEDERRRARLYYKVDLFYRGYQNLGPWDESQWTYETSDGDPMDAVENRFQRNVLINAGSLIRQEPSVTVRAASPSFNDLEAAAAGSDALQIQYERIEYEQVVADKSLFKTLFGNAFMYTASEVDRKVAPIMKPKFRYQDVQIPGESYCPDCGVSQPEGTATCPECQLPMMGLPGIGGRHKVQDGYDEIPHSNIMTVVCSPLEIKVRASSRRFKRTPYVQWITAEDIDEILYAYPGLDIGSGTGLLSNRTGTIADEPRVRLQQILAAIPGYIGEAMGIWGQTRTSGAMRRNMAMVNRVWLRPQMFRNDPDLLKQAPEGIRSVLVDGKVADWEPANIDDEWTHEVYIRNPHSLYGDGMFSDIPIQGQINRVNALQMRYMDNCTAPKRLYDVSMVVDEDLMTNDPKDMWTPIQVEPDKGLDRAIYTLQPAPLPPFVQNWKAQVLEADKDVSRASDPRAGQIPGANTPYAAQVLAIEQGQVGDLVSMKYNNSAVRQHARQLLQRAKVDWVDKQTLMQVDQNTGRRRWRALTREDLMRGEFTVQLRLDDFRPKTRSEAIQALEYVRNFGIDIVSSPKLRLEFLEKVGINIEGDMLSTQARRAHRQKDRIIEAIQGGQPAPQPDELVDDGTIQFPTLMEFLASEEGEQLQEDQPDAWKAVKEYAWTAMQMTMMKMNAMSQAGQGAAGGGGLNGPSGPNPNPATPPSAPRGTSGAPALNTSRPPSPQQFTQSPVAEEMKHPLPPNPQPARP